MAKKKKSGSKPAAKPASKKTPTRKKEFKKKKDEPHDGFTVVGIGASAGGLEALEKFFANMPGNPGMAFVVVTHLDPDHASMMPSLLRKHSPIPVFQVEDGMTVEKNQAYVIPPDREMGIVNGVLQLIKIEAAAGPRAPVNYFFRHLAYDRREKAVAVILSGMGSDGTLGLKAIKGELGMVMVQDPGTAKFNGMPNSAIASGFADYVLPPEKMPAQIVEYVKRFIVGVPKALPPEEIPSNSLQKIFMFLRAGAGHDFSGYKTSTIMRRIQRRMNVHQIEDISKYVVFLQKSQQEIKSLFKELLIGVTSFFRDPEAFEVFTKKAIPLLLEDKPYKYMLRAWVPGCSTGEEAYSLAILLQESMEALNREMDVQIFATDIDHDSIERARAGMYPGDIAADMSSERLNKFFVREDDSYQVSKKIRGMLVFASQSIIKDPPFTKLDLICCRNLLIYLDTELQGKILPLFHYSLKPEGILFLGSSETIGATAGLFSPIDTRWKIYRRKRVQGLPGKPVEFPLGAFLPVGREARAGKPETMDLQHVVARELMEHHTPPAVVTDDRGDILFIHGRTGKFLEPAAGTARTNNIIEMARGDLRIQLPALLRSAVTEKEEAGRTGLSVRQNGDRIHVSVRVRPLGETGNQGMYLFLFEELPLPGPGKKRRKKGAGREGSELGVKELEKELSYTRESLQTTIEELETANEELKSANEEHQSTNEELQSANEELNSSKEELQSLNEELETVNAELQDKNMELTNNYNDLKNTLDSTEIPILFLDRKFRIRRFTSHINKVINLRDTDLGRPVTDLVTRLNYKNLFTDARDVLDTLTPKEVETRAEDNRWYLARIRPYKTLANVIDGVVISFLDVHEQKTAELEAKSFRMFVDNVFHTIREPLLVLDKDLKVVSANRAFYSTFRVLQEDTKGQFVYDLGDKQWDIPELRNLLEKAISKNKVFEGFVVEREFPVIGKKKMLINARKVKHEGGAEILPEEYILLAIEDVTRKEQEHGKP